MKMARYECTWKPEPGSRWNSNRDAPCPVMRARDYEWTYRCVENGFAFCYYTGSDCRYKQKVYQAPVPKCPEIHDDMEGGNATSNDAAPASIGSEEQPMAGHGKPRNGDYPVERHVNDHVTNRMKCMFCNGKGWVSDPAGGRSDKCEHCNGTGKALAPNAIKLIWTNGETLWKRVLEDNRIPDDMKPILSNLRHRYAGMQAIIERLFVNDKNPPASNCSTGRTGISTPVQGSQADKAERASSISAAGDGMDLTFGERGTARQGHEKAGGLEDYSLVPAIFETTLDERVHYSREPATPTQIRAVKLSVEMVDELTRLTEENIELQQRVLAAEREIADDSIVKGKLRDELKMSEQRMMVHDQGHAHIIDIRDDDLARFRAVKLDHFRDMEYINDLKNENARITAENEKLKREINKGYETGKDTMG